MNIFCCCHANKDNFPPSFKYEKKKYKFPISEMDISKKNQSELLKKKINDDSELNRSHSKSFFEENTKIPKENEKKSNGIKEIINCENDKENSEIIPEEIDPFSKFQFFLKKKSKNLIDNFIYKKKNSNDSKKLKKSEKTIVCEPKIEKLVFKIIFLLF